MTQTEDSLNVFLCSRCHPKYLFLSKPELYFFYYNPAFFIAHYVCDKKVKFHLQLRCNFLPYEKEIFYRKGNFRKLEDCEVELQSRVTKLPFREHYSRTYCKDTIAPSLVNQFLGFSRWRWAETRDSDKEGKIQETPERIVESISLKFTVRCTRWSPGLVESDYLEKLLVV